VEAGKPVGKRAAQRTTRTALDRARERKALGCERNPRWGQWGQGGATNLSAEQKRAKTWCLGSRRGSGEASRSFGGLPPFGGIGVLGRVTESGQRRKKEGVTQNHLVPVQEGRERPLAWLDRGNSAGAGDYRPGGFHTGNLLIKG
jgi:hypothetical protein